MDVISHGLWATAVAEVLRRRGVVTTGQVAGTAAFGLMPDLMALVPVSIWAVGSESSIDAIRAYVFARPGSEPVMAPWAHILEHHIHCSAHSIIILSLITLLSFWRVRWMLVPLTGWWVHLALDVPTHSSEYYAVTVFYPLTEWSFDGIAWTHPAVLGMNYAALTLVYTWLFLTRKRLTLINARGRPDRGRPG